MFNSITWKEVQDSTLRYSIAFFLINVENTSPFVMWNLPVRQGSVKYESVMWNASNFIIIGFAQKDFMQYWALAGDTNCNAKILAGSTNLIILLFNSKHLNRGS